MSIPTLTINLPLATVSEANKREHWGKTYNRRKKQRSDTYYACRSESKPPQPPLTVKLTRISPRRLDEGDNLPMSMKAVRDGIADWLGIDDGSDKIKWLYGQKKGVPKERAVLIEIWPVTDED